MPSDKPRIATYTDDITIQKFKIVSAYNDMSMSEYLDVIIKQSIADHEAKYGVLKI